MLNDWFKVSSIKSFFIKFKDSSFTFIGEVNEVFDVKNNIKKLYYKKKRNKPYEMKSSINYKRNRRYNITSQLIQTYSWTQIIIKINKIGLTIVFTINTVIET